MVDDHSTDNTWEVVEAYCRRDARIKLLRRPEDRPKGANACRNYGFEISSGEFIQWFDSDDLMHDGMVEIKLNLIKETNYPFVVSKVDFFESKDLKWCDIYSLKSSNPLLDFLSFDLRFYTPGPLFRRLFLNCMDNLFDENLQRHQETEFFFRILLHNPDYSIINSPLSSVRFHSDSTTKTFGKQEESIKAKKNSIYYLKCYKNFSALASEKRYTPEFKQLIYAKLRKEIRKSRSIFFLIDTYYHILSNRLCNTKSEIARSFYYDFKKIIRVNIDILLR